MPTLLAMLALLLAIVALVVALVPQLAGRRQAQSAEGLPADVLGLRQEVAALRAEAAGSLRHLAVVRYDAFGDMGGQMSWSVALLDDAGDGVVLSSIHGRSEARSYAKPVTAWSSDQVLSPEEQEAVTNARP